MKNMDNVIILGVAAIFFLFTSNLTNQVEGNVRRPSRDMGVVAEVREMDYYHD